MKKILLIIGTRPEAIKMCPLLKELEEKEEIEPILAVTGQHRELLSSALSVFGVKPNYDLQLMRQSQSLCDLTARITEGVGPLLRDIRPDLVLVHGDTTTAFGSALAAFYEGIPIGHVEAGLRTYDLSAPFPEEWNRRAVSLLARYHFAPTEKAKENLLSEGIPKERILVTGNTGIDALRYTVKKDFSHPLLDFFEGGRPILLTAHRRESQGEAMRAMLRGIRRFAKEHPEARILYPTHPSPAVRRIAEEALGGIPSILLCDPLDTVTFHNLLARSYFCVTDSGGIQEEAVSLSKPTLVLRDLTERPEGILAGGARLIGRSEGSVFRALRDLWEAPALWHAMATAPSPYGDGFASRRIADYLEAI